MLNLDDKEFVKYKKFRLARNEILAFLDYYLLDHSVYTAAESGGCRDIDESEVRQAVIAYLSDKYLND